MAAELRLNVSLDLGFFRQQLQKLTVVAQSEFTPKLNVKFNRSTLDTELNNLQAAIKRRVYRIEIGGNIDQLPDKIKSLKEQLASLESFKIDLGVGAVKSLSKKDARQIATDLRTQILGEQSKIYVPVSIKPSITRADVRDFQNAVKSKLTGITVKVQADLEAASISRGAKSQSDIDADVRRGLQAISEIGASRMAGGGGGVTEAARREQLRQSLTQGGLNIENLRGVGKQLGVGGVGRFKKTSSLIEKIVADASLEMIKKYLDPQAVMRNPDRSGISKVLDTFARGIFGMLGMDPASIRAQQAERRRIPNIDFNPTVPPRSFSIGPSSTGRALPPGVIAKGLPGTAFGAQKYLPTELGEELKQVLRGAANAFVDAVKQNIRAVKITDLGAPVSRQGLLGGRTPAGFLPAGVGRVPDAYSTGRLGREGETREQLLARREREARMRSALRGVDIMGAGPSRIPAPYSQSYRAARPTSAIIPYAAPGALVAQGGGAPPGGPPGGGGGGRGFNLGPNFGRDLGRGFMGSAGGGVISEITSEFTQATKQVLLFGTAYKALAAITALPGNIINATANLQSFRNQLEAVTGGGEIMTNSLKLIEDTIAKFNMPIDSARQGFVRLYASMAPAGISGGTIDNIFTGLAAASTTLGMSSDQVDRMTYALSQMASKGQITSEELKGQLGDVFPQAVSLFAKAAGFLNDEMDAQSKAKGLSSFLKALEDGALRGEAMSKVLSNVGVLLNQDFGPAGEKAAAAFRGQITALNNALTSFYESFAPVASQFLGEFIQPIVQGLTAVGDAVKLALSGEAVTNNPLAAYFKNELFPQLKNIKTALQGAGQVFVILAQSIGVTLRPLAQFLLGNQALVSSVARGLVVFAAFRTVVAALNALGIIPLIASIVRYGAVYRIFITQTAAGASGITAFNTAMSRTGLSATAAITGIRALATTIRTVLVTSAIGIAIVAIGALIERISQLQAVTDSIKARGKGVTARLGAAAKGGPEALKQQEAEIRAEIKSANKLRALYVKGTTKKGLTDEELKFIQDQGGDTSMFGMLFGGGARASLQSEIRRANEAAVVQQRTLLTMQGELQQALPGASQNALVVERRNQEQTKVNLTGLGAGLSGSGTGADKPAGGEKELKEFTNNRIEVLRKRLEAEKAFIDASSDLVQRERDIEKARLNFKYGNQIIDEQLVEAQRTSLEYQVKDRARFLAEQNELAKVERQILVSQQRTTLAGGLISGNEALSDQYQELAILLSHASSGYAELSASQKAEIDITKTLTGLSGEERKGLASDIAYRRQLAAAIDALTPKLEKERKLTELRNQLRMAGIFDPKLALREQIRQETPLFSDEQVEEVAGLQEQVNKAQEYKDAMINVASTIGDAFSSAFKGIITGSMTAQQALAGMFQSIADSFADMVAKMIAEWLKAQLIKGFMEIIGMIIPGMTALGGASNSLTGAGALTPGAGAMSSLPTSYGAGSGGGLGSLGQGGGFGGWSGPMFANGGIVSGPTLGLVGEGRYNEAIIPLPDGKSVPVQLSGGDGGNQIISNITVNVSNGQAQSNATGSNSSEMGRKIEGAVKQVIVGELRPGGLLASR